MRRISILIALVVTGGLLTACGKSAHSTARSPLPSSKGTGAAASKEALSKPRAIAFAHAVNLRAEDVPGFAVSSTHERKSATERRLEHEMLRCAGTVGSGRGIAEVSSGDFEYKHNVLDLGVSSEVSVAQTSALAARELVAIRSAHVRGCFSHYLDLLFKSQQYRGASVNPISIQSGTPPAPGTAGSFGWRVTATFVVRRIRVSLYLDLLGFVYGPARVTLFSSGALRPFPAGPQQHLFSLLLARAKLHGL